MIVTEFYMTRTDGVSLIRTYSNEGFRVIRDDGVVFDEAIDIEGSAHTYLESDELADVFVEDGGEEPEVDPPAEIEEELTAEEALAIILGEGET